MCASAKECAFEKSIEFVIALFN